MGLPVARVSDSPPRKKRGGGRSNAHAQVTPASPPKPNHIVAPQFASYEGEVGDILSHCALPPVARRRPASIHHWTLHWRSIGPKMSQLRN